MKKLFLAGAGAIAHHHADAARLLNPAPELFAADPSPAARERFAAAFPEAVLSDSVDELLSRPPGGEPEVVVVATPPFLHHEHALAALRGGRHVLVEKPFVLDPAHADELLAEARARGLQLACCSSRFSSRRLTAEIRRRLIGGAVGDGWRVRWLVRSHGIPGIDYQPESRWFLDRSKAGGGSLLDWGCYDLAMWTEIFQPVAITVDAAWINYPRRGPQPPPEVRFDVEHQVVVHFRLHRDGAPDVPVSFERASTGYGGDIDIIQIEGSRGALEWNWIDWNGRAIRWHHERSPGDTVVDASEFDGGADEPHFHHRPLHALAARLAGQPCSDIANEQAVFNAKVLHAVYAVAREGRPVTVHMPR